MSLLTDKKLFLFDFDGTLADTSLDILASINHVRRHYHLAELDFAHAKQYIGIGLKALVEGIVAENSKINIEEAVQVYREHHVMHILDHVQLYPGVRATLDLLQAKAKKIGIISNKYSVFIEQIMQHLAPQLTWDIILGPDRTINRKPHPEPIYVAAEKCQVSLAESVIIGDSIYDIRAGKAAGITTVACLYGFGDKDELLQDQPDLTLNNFSELTKI